MALEKSYMVLFTIIKGFSSCDRWQIVGFFCAIAEKLVSKFHHKSGFLLCDRFGYNKGNLVNNTMMQNIYFLDNCWRIQDINIAIKYSNRLELYFHTAVESVTAITNDSKPFLIIPSYSPEYEPTWELCKNEVGCKSFDYSTSIEK